MRFFKHLLFSFALFCAGTSSWAQGGLSMGNFLHFFSNDTLNSTDTLYFTAVTSNTTPGTNFNGYLDFRMDIDTMNTNGTNPVNLDSIHGISLPGLIFLAPNDTFAWSGFVQLTVHQNCKSGINTVVIWPVARPGSPAWLPTVDSLRKDIFITEPTGLRKPVQNGVFVVGPNPFSDRIDIICRGQNTVEQVRIIDMQGMLVYENAAPKKTWIDTSALAQGVYYVQITFADGYKTIIKTIKQ